MINVCVGRYCYRVLVRLKLIIDINRGGFPMNEVAYQCDFNYRSVKQCKFTDQANSLLKLVPRN